MLKSLKNLMNKEPVCSFLFKGALSAAMGVLVATTFDFGGRVYRSIRTAPRCRVRFVSNDSIGFIYEWEIKIPDQDMGSLAVYPKDDVLILLESLKKNERLTSMDLIHPTVDGKNAKGAIFLYRDGEDLVTLTFQSYSRQMLTIKKLEKAKCEDLFAGI